ncbi:hypothetical protein LRH25_32510, partial [Ideonella azotifigens]|nr:hypothetical protein [Ideonella azotifigens]
MFPSTVAGWYESDGATKDRLQALPWSNYLYFDSIRKSIEEYDYYDGSRQIVYAGGGRVSLNFSKEASADAPGGGYLLSVQDQFGRLVKFKYDTSGVITQVTRVDGQVIDAAYTNGNLSALIWPDGKNLQFVYDKPGLPWALTGVVDEDSLRLTSFWYDDVGRAVSTEEGAGLNRYSASWNQGSEPGWNITEEFDDAKKVVWIHHRWSDVGNVYVQGPNGYSSTLGSSTVQGMSYASTQTQPGGSGCSAASSSQSFDGNANVTSRVDFAGNRSCMAYDTSRNLETVRVEGLKTADTCPADVASYTASNPGPAKPQRKISTQWHPLWNLQTQVVEPNLITT